MNTLEDETGTTDAINGYGFRNLTLNNLYIFFVFCERRLIDTDLYGFYWNTKYNGYVNFIHLSSISIYIHVKSRVNLWIQRETF